MAEAELSEQEASAALDGAAASSGSSTTRKTLARLRTEAELLPARVNGLRVRLGAAGEVVLEAFAALQAARRDFAASLKPAFQRELDEGVSAFNGVLQRRHVLSQFGVDASLEANFAGLAAAAAARAWRDNPDALQIEKALGPIRTAAVSLERLADKIKRDAASRAPATVPIGPTVTKAVVVDERPETPARTVAPEGVCRKCGIDHAREETCENAMSRCPKVTVGAAA